MIQKDTPMTAPYRIIADAGGNRYRFFCSLSGAAMLTTNPVCAESPSEELRLAWESEGRQHFNRCARCGRWVSGVMYNADVLQCVECAPWETRPNYCPQCGKRVPFSDNFCHNCGTKLQYRKEGDG